MQTITTEEYLDIMEVGTVEQTINTSSSLALVVNVGTQESHAASLSLLATTPAYHQYPLHSSIVNE